MDLITRELPVDAGPVVAQRVERLAKRARRLGFPEPTFSVGEPYLDRTPGECPGCKYSGGHEDLPHPMTEWATFTISAERPMTLGDWSFAARVDALDDGSPFVVRVPGWEGDLPTIANVNTCEHCAKQRRRSETFLVSGPEGIKQVGRSCLKDFTGHDPASLLSVLSSAENLLRDEADGWSVEPVTPTPFVLTSAARIVAKAGYTSKAHAEAWQKPSTASLVFDLIHPIDSKHRVELRERFPLDDEANALADNTMAALADLREKGTTNEWEQNLLTITAQANQRPRHIGIVTSAVILGLRRTERPAKAEQAPSHHIGQAGQRLTVEATVTFFRHFEREWPETSVTLVKFQTADGADLLWWASNASTLTVDEKVSLTGTIKKHETDARSGRPVTVLTRCKVATKAVAA